MRWSVLIVLAACSRPSAGGDASAASASAPAASASASATPLYHGRVYGIVTPPVGGVNAKTVDRVHFLSTAYELKICSASRKEPTVSCSRMDGLLAIRDGEPKFWAFLADSESGESFPVVSFGERSPKKIYNSFLTEHAIMETDASDVGVDATKTFVHLTRTLGLKRDTYTLRRKSNDAYGVEREKAVTFDLDGDAGRTFFAMPWLLAGDADGKDVRVRARRVGGADQIGPWVDVGKVSASSFTVRGACRSDAGLALFVAGAPDRVLFERAGKWTWIDVSSGPPADHRVGLAPSPRFDCDGDRIVASWLKSDALAEGAITGFALMQLACAIEGCERFEARFVPPGAPPYKKGADYVLPYPRLAWVGGWRMLLWDAPDGTRMRFGDIEHGDGNVIVPPRHWAGRILVHGPSAYVLADHPTEIDVVGVRVDGDAGGAVTTLTRWRAQ